MPDFKVIQISNERGMIGEGPHWDSKDQMLYYVDIFEGDVVRYDPATEQIVRSKAGVELPSFIIPVSKDHHREPNLFVIGAELKIILIRWDGQSPSARVVETLSEFKEHPGGRLNDGKADYTGRIFTGTMEMNSSPDLMTSTKGSLFSLSPSGKEISVHLRRVGISNGLSWNEQKRKMYFADSLKYNIREFDYDDSTGNMSNERVVIDLKNKLWNLPDCIPDGMTIDTEGNLWVALHDGSRVIKVEPESGQITATVMFPVKQVTSVCWGGQNLDILYVTTGAVPIDGVKPPLPAGTLFKVVGLNARGYPSSTAKFI